MKNILLIIFIVIVATSCLSPEEGIEGLIGSWEQKSYRSDGLMINKIIVFDKKNNFGIRLEASDFYYLSNTSSVSSISSSTSSTSSVSTVTSYSKDVFEISGKYYINQDVEPKQIDLTYKKVLQNSQDITSKDKNDYYTNYIGAITFSAIFVFPSLNQKSLGIYDIEESRLKLAFSKPDETVRPTFFSSSDYIFKYE